MLLCICICQPSEMKLAITRAKQADGGLVVKGRRRQGCAAAPQYINNYKFLKVPGERSLSAPVERPVCCMLVQAPVEACTTHHYAGCAQPPAGRDARQDGESPGGLWLQKCRSGSPSIQQSSLSVLPLEPGAGAQHDI